MSKSLLLLISIFLLALFLRMYNLASLPSSLHHDELINVYVGRFILENGRDLYGNSWPIFYFDKFGDYPPVLPMYLSGVATMLFGTNEFAARFPAAFFGSLTVFAVYLLGLYFLENKKYALIATFFFAILPWHIILSRYSAEGVIGLASFTMALAFLLQGLQKINKKLIVISLLLFLLSYLLYPSFRVLTPPVLLPIVLLFDGKRKRYVLLCFFTICLVVTLLIGLTPWGSARFRQTSLFTSTDVAGKLTAFQNEEGQDNILLARTFHNKVSGFTNEFIRQYTSYFSADFLFSKGGFAHINVIPDKGLIYVTYGLLFTLLILPAKHVLRGKPFYYLLYLLLVAPIPAALTVDFVPNEHRSLFMSIPLVIFVAYGFSKLDLLFAAKARIVLLLRCMIIFLLMIEFTYFAHQYIKHIDWYKSVFKDDGNKELITYLLENRGKYQEVVAFVGESLPLYYLFYKGDFDGHYVDKFYQGKSIGRIFIDKIDNIHFTEDPCPSKRLAKRQLLVQLGNCNDVLGEYEDIKSIFRKDQTRAYRLFKGKENQ